MNRKSLRWYKTLPRGKFGVFGKNPSFIILVVIIHRIVQALEFKFSMAF